MYIKRLTATFGRLENETLELGPGLNIIQAPNEGGKSTWTAFLRVMLYGLNTRDRSAAADKRRYLPWSGSPMQGSMDLTCSRGDVTVTRRTARTNSPMGGFSAVYTGTNNAVERLTAADCGEALTGVPLEVFERSAYIRQSGIAVDQSAALERRIAALITTGEEDTSFSDAYEKLKKQLNRRRYNKSGILPQLEQEIAQLRQTQQETDALRRQLMQAKEREPELEKLLQETRSQIRQHELCDMAQRAAEAVAAKKAYDEAGAKQEELAEALTHLQPKAVWEDALTKIAAYRASCKDADNFDKIVFDSETHLQRAKDSLAAHPLGRYTPAQAEQLPLEEKPRPKALPLWFPLTALVCAAAAAFAMTQNGVFWYVALGSCLGAWGAITLALALPRQKQQKAWDTQHAALLGARHSQLEEYYIIYDEVQAAQAELQVAGSARDNARAVLAQRQAELLALTGTADADGAERAAREALALYRRAEEAAEVTHRERARWETAAKLAPEMPEEIPQRPHTDPNTLRRREETAAAELAVLRRSIHTETGKLQALGDPILTDTRLQQLEERRDTAQQEYDAIALAMETLQDANSRMQNRFSPALGEKSANFFTKLTKGKYNRVLLDREMNPSAQEAGQIIPRETTLLSQGAADQLYLAVRLAICEMVLPEEDPAPILLDDALVTFDDERCAAALQVLTELAKKRQILLFTCQSREAALLKSGTDHHIITL